MRKIFAAAMFGLVLGVAGAASNPDDAAPEGRAYLGFSFGGERPAPRDFHYGLRVDQDSRYVEGQVPPMMQLDFTPRGLNAANLNGVPMLKPQQYRLRQTEQPAEQPAPTETPAEGAAPAEEEGFFARMWHGITGFFGGGDEKEEAPAEETADAEQAPAEDAGEQADGPFANYNVVDWGLLALGAVGLGMAVGEISNGEDSPNPQSPTTGPTTPGGASPTPTLPTGSTTPILPTGIPGSLRDGYAGTITDEMRERMEWLDGGTGQMGDLQPQD